MKEKCYLCEKGTITRKKVDYELHGIHIGRFEAEVCDSCKEEFYDEAVSKKITAIVKKKGLFGLAAKTKIGQSGSTLDIRLPKRITQFLNLKKGTEVEIFPEGKNKLVVTI